MNCANPKKYAFIFPGAGMSALQNFLKSDTDSTLREKLYENAQISRYVTGIDVWNYISSPGSVQNEELTEQIALHTVNCSIGELLQKQGMEPSTICGYSMGIYSALVYGKAVDFESALDMIQNAYYLMKISFGEKTGAMAAVIGLNRKELEGVIASTHTTYPVEIANSNGKYNMIITGIFEDVSSVKKNAENDGALKVVDIKVSLPYHHSLLLSDAAEVFLNYLRHVRILDLQIPLISSIDQNTITGGSDVRFELYKNIKRNMSWYTTIEAIAASGVTDFVEVGKNNPLPRCYCFF
ncbi:MAG TPA: ACP S-malonyltransferase [Clostridia bacterium]|nr:ACP S-malonyltransferase [Clostridia bacterium]